MDQHVRHDLSAYLDDALPADRAGAVRLHVADCGSCRSDLAQLRETARLLAALPAPAPSRRLVPSLAPRFNWLRPLRSLSAVGAGMFLLVFMASATLDTGWRMGGGSAGTTVAGPAAATAGAAVPQSDTTTYAATATPAAPAALSAASASPEKAAEQRTTAASPGVPPDQNAGNAESDAASRSGSGPGTANDSVAMEPPQIGPSPWLWLALMLVSAGIALGAHRRMRGR